MRMLSGCLALSLFLAQSTVCAQPTESESAPFAGPYLGIEVGRQNVFSGALIDGVDILGQQSRTVAGLIGGYRWQFGGGWVVGLEAELAWVDGDLAQIEAGDRLRIDYETDAQYGIGLSLGHVLGFQDLWHLFGYVQVTERDFDVNIATPIGQFSQQDGQGFTRFGLGLERRLGDAWHLRGTLGLVSVDFGRKPTSQDVEDGVDLMLAVVRQF